MKGVILSGDDLLRQYYHEQNAMDERMEQGLAADPPEDKESAMSTAWRYISKYCHRCLGLTLGAMMLMQTYFALKYFFF